MKESTFITFLTALFIITFGLFVTQPGGAQYLIAISNISYVVFAAIAAIVGIIAVRAYGIKSPQGKLLLLLTLVPVFDTIAGSIWAWYEIGLGIISPFPSVADWFWLMFYLSGIAAFSFALSKLLKFIETKHFIVSCAVIALLFLGAYSFSLKEVFGSIGTASAAEVFFGAMYPVGDILLIGLSLLMFMTLQKGVFGKSWRTFTIALCIYGVADLVYSYGLFIGTYRSGGLIDLLWPAANALIAYAFYQQFKAVQTPNATS